MTTPTSETQLPESTRPTRLIVVAASAQGIRALGQLLEDLPERLSAPVVIVQHLRPRPDTKIAEVLAHRSTLPVKLAEDGEAARPGTAYVAPPDRTLVIGSDGVFTLKPPAHQVHPAADPLFEAAADAYGSGVIGCVLTGMGNDGASGVKAIKAHGGTVIVQDPDSADVRDMPDAALAATDADFVLPLGQIASAMTRLVTERA